MQLTQWNLIRENDVIYLEEYTKLYKKFYSQKTDEFDSISHENKQILEQVRDKEFNFIFQSEVSKLKLLDPDTDLDDTNLRDITKNLLNEDDYSLYEMDSLINELRLRIDDDVMVFYDEVERNIKGRYDWLDENGRKCNK